MRSTQPESGSEVSAVETRQKSQRNKSTLYKYESRMGYLFILAPFIQLLLFVLGPCLYSLYAAFTDWNGLGQIHLIGFGNFAEMFGEPRFWKSFYNTFFMMLGIPVGLFLSLLLAMALNRNIKGTNAFRVIYYIPVVSSLAAIAILWQWAYNGDYGLINQFLALFHIKGPNWLQNEYTIKPAIMIMAIWKGLGYSMLLYLAALQSIPRIYLEAANLDGANAFQIFKNITIPMVRPVTFFIVVTSIIGGSQMFIEPNIMTADGGPMYSAGTVVYYVWQKAFQNYQMGYASAVAWVLGVFIFIVTLIQFRHNRKYDYE
jgi:ABC-type sugar transport systems, permease components